MQRLSQPPVSYEFSRHVEPRLRIKSGETFLVETLDALSGQISKAGDVRDKSKVPYSNPITGPVYVEGALPGDTLAVTIHEIRPISGQCATYTGSPRQLGEWLGIDPPQNAHVCPIREGQIYWSDTLTIPYAPMLGCLGTSPDWGVPSTLPAGTHGGNMDIVEVCPGNTIYLPVFVPGAFLWAGDAHAAMGHGELSATGLEMASETVLSVNLLKKTVPGPRIESPTELITVATGCPMERSIAQAYSWLILWMEAEYGWDRWKAYDLLTHVGRISVGYYGLGTAATKIEKKYLT